MKEFQTTTSESTDARHVGEETNESTTEGNLCILGSELIDDVLISLSPALKSASSKNIRIISRLIKGYLFKDESILGIIKRICNDDVIIYIQGLRTIILEKNIIDIHGINDYLKYSNNDIDSERIIDNILKSKAIDIIEP